MFRAFRSFLLGVVWLSLAACGDLKEYEGQFSGAIVDGNFVRSCFAAGTTAELDFDPNSAVGPVDESQAGRLSKLTTSDGTFDRTPLRPPMALPHDALSELTFPGPARLRNYLLLARPEQGPLAGRDATVIVSLLENGRIEVRVLARTEETSEDCAAEPEPPPGEELPQHRAREYFGVFRLK